MPHLTFQVLSVRTDPLSVAPTLIFTLKTENSDENEEVVSIILRCQINIEAQLRLYDPDGEEAERLFEIFDRPNKFGTTLRSLVWAQTTVLVPRFIGSGSFEVPIVFTYDYEVTSAKYFSAIKSGEIPIAFLFSGTILYKEPTDDGRIQISRIPSDTESAYRLPLATWKLAVEDYFPNSAWLRLQRDTVEKLYAYKVRKGVPTLDQALQRLIDSESLLETGGSR